MKHLKKLIFSIVLTLLGLTIIVFGLIEDISAIPTGLIFFIPGFVTFLVKVDQIYSGNINNST